MIIGVTGPICSGIDSFGKILQEKGFKWISYSDILKEEAKKRKMDITRTNLQDLGDELRKKEGHGVLSKRIIEKMIAGEDYVVGNIRNPGEVEELRKLGDFVLVKLDAAQEIRFGRLMARGREGDPKNFADFMKIESRDLGISQKPHGQQHNAVFEMAEKVISNEGSEERLSREVDKMLWELGWKK